MGRGKRGRTQRRDFGDGVRENVWKKQRDDGWAPFVLESPAFEKYYKAQKIMATEEWELFLATLRKQLPTTFRINGSGRFATAIRDQMQRDFFDCLKDGAEIDGEKVEPARALPWYPENLAWHISCSRSQLRKVPILQRIHEFLKQENESGSISRQEAVSMVPPLFLDVKPEHRVLDMCAAPGSKTFQLLETIHSKDERGVLPKGTVVANDSDVQRCNLLIHQTKRMCSPNILVTNHDAQSFPGLKSKGSEGIEGLETQLTFDRVLCDVPCSGDGTIRKAPDLWKKWNPGAGNGLHRLQLQIAMRGVALLKVGGRMVYSTCSLNPIEDEAVVGEILRLCDGSLELLDVSSELPELKRRPGLTSWRVRGKKRWFSCYSSYKGHDKYRSGVVVASMFPSGKAASEAPVEMEIESPETPVEETGIETSQTPAAENEEPKVEETEFDGDAEVSDLPLERCMRILPHDQDTGGFFVAVFKKVRPFAGNARKEDEAPLTEADGSTAADELPVPASEPAAAEEEHEDPSRAPPTEELAELEMPESEQGVKIQKQGQWFGVDPVLFLKDEKIISSLVDYYGISESFPLAGHLIIRSEDTSRVKRIYYVSSSVGDVLRLNLQAKQALKVTSAGLKIFERHSNKEMDLPCHFRIASEGLPLLLPHMSKQILHANKEVFKTLLAPDPVHFSAIEDAEFATCVQSLRVGCCVVVLKTESGDKDEIPTAIGCWRGRSNISLLIPRIEADQMLQRLY